MTSPHRDLPSLDLETPALLRVSPLLRDLQERGPVCLVRTPAGDEGWLVTRHSVLKQLLNDERIGHSHPDPANAAQYVRNPFLDLMIADTDAETARRTHTESRRLLAPMFSARRVREMEPRVAAVVDAVLDDFTAQEPPGDLHGGVSVPVARTVLCDIIGVPPQNREHLTALLSQTAVLGDREGVQRTQRDLYAFVGGLVEHKRAEPGQDIITRLAEGGLSDERVTHLAVGLLFAGLDSVVTIMDHGVVLLATHPEQRAAALADPDVMTHAVEEVLRAAKAGGSILPRYATEDLTVGGETIRAGDLVLFDFSLPNFDVRAFDEPERFDVTRSPNQHLTFAHGMWHCIGAPLARIELNTVFTQLFTRLPDLRLALPAGELAENEGRLSGGLSELPVTW
ncbi:cytochrome P450 [Streptomyces sp. NPDC004296]|uniref:cytochrome P450 n=1 Tax=Streptomyces sp. NPDC004296 TaxID=3364697 RepID=UPI0036846DF4